jgi:hypothetical protein
MLLVLSCWGTLQTGQNGGWSTLPGSPARAHRRSCGPCRKRWRSLCSRHPRWWQSRRGSSRRCWRRVGSWVWRGGFGFGAWGVWGWVLFVAWIGGGEGRARHSRAGIAEAFKLSLHKDESPQRPAARARPRAHQWPAVPRNLSPILKTEHEPPARRALRGSRSGRARGPRRGRRGRTPWRNPHRARGGGLHRHRGPHLSFIQPGRIPNWTQATPPAQPEPSAVPEPPS